MKADKEESAKSYKIGQHASLFAIGGKGEKWIKGRRGMRTITMKKPGVEFRRGWGALERKIR